VETTALRSGRGESGRLARGGWGAGEKGFLRSIKTFKKNGGWGRRNILGKACWRMVKKKGLASDVKELGGWGTRRERQKGGVVQKSLK